MLISYFHIFQRGFEVLNAIFQTSVHVSIATAIVYYNMLKQRWCDVEMLTGTPLEHTPHDHLTFLVRFWASPDEPSILVLPTVILRPRVSRDVLQACNWIFKSSKLSLMMARSSACRSSQGQPIRHSQERASITIARSSGLKTEPWYTPTVT